MLLLVASSMAMVAPPSINQPTKYDPRRAMKIFQELGQRAVGMTPTSTTAVLTAGNEDLKEKVLNSLAPFGDPALNVDASTFNAVNSACKELEAKNPAKTKAAAIGGLQGTWKVRFSDAPPPSNGALGPFRGRAFQVVDVDSRTYSNELSVGPLDVKLMATFEEGTAPPSSTATALRVAFKSIAFSVFGLALPKVSFPEGTERTWLLTYTDSDTRLVRAGVDGGKSTARELGLIDQAEGEAADSYLFVLTRATEADRSRPQGAISPLATNSKRRALKQQLIEACDGQRKGADSDPETVAKIDELMQELASVNPTPDPASSPLLTATWDIVWTTESELLALTSSGFLGLPCTGSYQTISRTPDEASPSGYAYKLDNCIDFDGGFLRVGSTCEPAQTGGRVDFRFESCKAKWKQFELPLPPVGAGFFEVLYMDDELRLCKDSRGDLQICTRRRA